MVANVSIHPILPSPQKSAEEREAIRHDITALAERASYAGLSIVAYLLVLASLEITQTERPKR